MCGWAGGGGGMGGVSVVGILTKKNSALRGLTQDCRCIGHLWFV